MPYGTQGIKDLLVCLHESWPNNRCYVNLRYVIKLDSENILYSLSIATNLLDSALLAQLPLKTIIKLLMPGPIDKIKRFRRCAIWHAQGHSKYLNLTKKQELNHMRRFSVASLDLLVLLYVSWSKEVMKDWQIR